MPLLTLTRASIAFGHQPLLEEATLQVEAGERVAVLGRNGAGKSTLLRLLAGEIEPDAGEIWRQPGVRVARLDQDVPLVAARPVFDVVADGLGELSELAAAYHRAAVAVTEHATPGALDELGRLQHALEERDGWRLEQRVELVLDRLRLPADAVVDTLSGGSRRRVLLARALVADPDVLLLDEPTNHLDIEAITWLEGFLAEFPGAVVFVTHDRAFLQRIASRVVDLDRGRLTSWPGDYATFVRKKEEWLANDATAGERLDRRLEQEEAWLRQGIKARRTRNEGRVRALQALRAERAARRTAPGTVRLGIKAGDPSGRLVFEAEGISKALGGVPVIDGLTLRVMRGDKIGLIGPNGAGKTTLLRLLLGELAPDTGVVRAGANVQVAYYDQQREQLDPDRTVMDTVGDGRDELVIDGRPRHVIGYLEDFLFPRERAQAPVRALSGGERNRLLLARLFTRPANVLVLDEPTNDLDLETLELLEARLVEWTGTVLLVSHDRAFLDNVVTSTLAFEGGGRVVEHVGGYADWLRQRPTDEDAGPRRPSARPAPVPAAAAPAEPRRRLSYNERRELERLPDRISRLEAEQRELGAASAAPEFYREPPDAIHRTLGRLAEIEQELLEAYARWDELDSRAS